MKVNTPVQELTRVRASRKDVDSRTNTKQKPTKQFLTIPGESIAGSTGLILSIMKPKTNMQKSESAPSTVTRKMCNTVFIVR
jgi:hypothetical protein